MVKRLLTFIMLQCIMGVAFAANYLTFTAEKDGSSFGIKNEDNNPDVQYSLDDGETWVQLVDGEMITLEQKGDRALLRGKNPEGFTRDFRKRTIFIMTGSIAASGSVMSLIDEEGESKKIPCKYCFLYLFKDCYSLISAPELPATELTYSCYSGMFMGCTWLKQAPELPAIVLAEECYECMFSSCSSLTQAPELPATVLAERCYNSMFSFCVSLTQVPELPATVLTESCYQSMFESCSSLTQAPKLPATVLTEYCYASMFQSCISLTQAPELPAMELAEGCYSSMFASSEIERAPKLPATKLAKSCYSSMFWGCTNLTEAPELPATKIVARCYNHMFYLCESLSKVTVNIIEWETPDDGFYETYLWLYNVAPTGTFICPKELEEKYGPSFIPEGWIVKQQEVDVSDIFSDNSWSVHTSHLTLFISGAKTTIEVYDLTGKLVARRNGGEDVEIAVPQKGVYLVKVGKRSQKVEL